MWVLALALPWFAGCPEASCFPSLGLTFLIWKVGFAFFLGCHDGLHKSSSYLFLQLSRSELHLFLPHPQHLLMVPA